MVDKIKKLLGVILFLGVIFIVGGCSQNNIKTVEFSVDNKSLIRNPAMGWGIYVDNYVKDNNTFWTELGDAPDKYCSFLYIRVLWSYMEPEEGKYVWENDDNYKNLIAEAKRRGLKLHFRVFYDSQDMKYAATPDFVRKAGAKGYTANTGHWSPYMDDPIFQDKLQNFITAFAKEYDDPNVVDCIDAFNIGWWGEGHHVNLKDPTKYEDVALWITDAYGNTFKNVLLVINYHNEITEPILDKILDRQDFILRHDAFGSEWYGDFERKFAKKEFPRRAILAESCYWFVSTDKGVKIHPDSVDDTERWRWEKKRKMDSWRDVYTATYEDAKEAHANTLDLREYREVRSWLSNAPDIVEQFMINGGYRFTPKSISFPETIKIGEQFTLKHSWINSGFGLLPNNNKRWNYKYKPAFALMDTETTTIHPIVIDKEAEPSDWLLGKMYEYSCDAIVYNLPAGNYKLAVSVYDTQQSKPGIRLAVDKAVGVDGWVIVGEIELKEK